MSYSLESRDCTNKLCTTHSYFHTLVTYFEKKTMMDSDQVITITITLSPQGSWPCCSARWPPPQSSPIGSWHLELPRITLNQINVCLISAYQSIFSLMNLPSLLLLPLRMFGCLAFAILYLKYH